ncbi:MAG: polymer-forming cytoskeletal protein [SAR324 cluster bacterium]|nr:polymer-forming cytoskeletal protein [SAR324 cluster bacterium]
MFGKKGTSTVKGDATTYIGTGMKIEGKLRCTGSIRIDGEIHGDIDCQSEVSIGPSATIVATIHAANVTVNGRIEGNLFTSDQLEVLSEGHIVGNVSNPPGKLIIHEGAVIEGQCFTYDTPKKLTQVTDKSNKGSKILTTQDKKLLDPPAQGKAVG